MVPKRNIARAAERSMKFMDFLGFKPPSDQRRTHMQETKVTKYIPAIKMFEWNQIVE